MEKFNSQQNDIIWVACEGVRKIMLFRASSIITPTALKIVKDTESGSIISETIEKHDWKKLFSNKEWLVILAGTLNLDSTGARECLRVISEYFPEETKKHLPPTMLIK